MFTYPKEIDSIVTGVLSTGNGTVSLHKKTKGGIAPAFG
jgi:hypothetical protein